MICRKALLMIVLCLNVGCSLSGNPETNAVLETLGLREREEFSPRYLSLIKSKAPVLQIGFPNARIGGGALLLESRANGFEYWLSPEGAQVVLQNGVLHGLRGFGEGLLASELSNPIKHIRNLRSGVSDRFHTYLDGNDQATTRTYRCVFEHRSAHVIKVHKKLLSAELMIERCKNTSQSFENLYWIDPKSRRIVLSRQWAGPVLGALSTRVVP